MAKHDELTIIAGILTIIAFSFFIYSIHITKITDNLTYLWIFLILLTQTLLFIYGKINNIFAALFHPCGIFNTKHFQESIYNLGNKWIFLLITFM